MIESLISDHFPIVFMLCLPDIPQVTSSDTRQTRVYLPHFCKDFTELYNKVNSSLSVELSLADLDTEHHFNSLNTVWTDILNSIAPVKCFKLKPKSEPLIDNNIRSLRQSCRKAERKWKKDKLQISFDILKNCLSLYQRAVKKAKNSYFSNLIEKHHCTLKILFSVINSALSSY